MNDILVISAQTWGLSTDSRHTYSNWQIPCKEAPLQNAASELPGVLGQGAPIQYAATEEITENRFLGQEVPIQNAAPEEQITNSFLWQEVPYPECCS